MIKLDIKNLNLMDSNIFVCYCFDLKENRTKDTGRKYFTLYLKDCNSKNIVGRAFNFDDSTILDVSNLRGKLVEIDATVDSFGNEFSLIIRSMNLYTEFEYSVDSFIGHYVQRDAVLDKIKRLPEKFNMNLEVPDSYKYVSFRNINSGKSGAYLELISYCMNYVSLYVQRSDFDLNEYLKTLMHFQNKYFKYLQTFDSMEDVPYSIKFEFLRNNASLEMEVCENYAIDALMCVVLGLKPTLLYSNLIVDALADYKSKNMLYDKYTTISTGVKVDIGGVSLLKL